MEFKKEKITSLAHGPEWHYTLMVQDEELTPRNGESKIFTIIANGKGVSFQGNSPLFWGQDGTHLLAKTIGEAFSEYNKLRPKLVSTLSGH